MTWVYLDTSVAVHALRGTPAAERWFDAVVARSGSALVSSRILQTELTRVLRRDGLPVSTRELILQHVSMAPVTDAILTAAEAITEPVKTLDAVHLATALALGSDTVVITHDANLERVAAVLGLATDDPIAGESADG